MSRIKGLRKIPARFPGAYHTDTARAQYTHDRRAQGDSLETTYLASVRSPDTILQLFALSDRLDNTSNTRFRLKLGLNAKYNRDTARHGRPPLCRRFT